MPDATRSRLDELRRLRFAKRWPWERDPRLPILRALAEAPDPRSFLDVLPLMAEAGDVGAAATDTMRALLDAVPVVDLPSLEQRVRHHLRYAYRASQSARALTRRPSRRGPFVTLALASFHPDGYVREVAVRRLGQNESGRELPFLLLRLDDWVAPIQGLAVDLLNRRLTADFVSGWVEALPILASLADRQRPRLGLIRSHVLRLLSDPGQPDALDGALRAPDRRVRRIAHRFAREAGWPLARRAAQVASADPDVLVRLETARALHRSNLDLP
ncbi:MAG: hypothetical protein AAFQ43_11580, partial [Bacteroidota bacterium]